MNKLSNLLWALIPTIPVAGVNPDSWDYRGRNVILIAVATDQYGHGEPATAPTCL